MKAVIASLGEHIRKIDFQHWKEGRISEEAGAESDAAFEKRAKKQWKELTLAEEWPEELSSLEDIILPPPPPVVDAAPTEGSAKASDEDNLSRAREMSSQRSPNRARSKVPQLLREDDGGVSCITLTDRDYSSFRFDDEAEEEAGTGNVVEAAGGFEGAQSAEQSSSRSNAEVILSSFLWRQLT